MKSMMQPRSNRIGLPHRSAQVALFESLEGRRLLSTTYYVNTKGDDANAGTDPSLAWRTVQKAFDAATPGSTVIVQKGKYKEKPILNVSGNATDGYITYQAEGKVTISGKGIAGQNIISINQKDYIRIIGFEIKDNVKSVNGSGIRLTTRGDHVELIGNKISKITGTNAMGITVYGFDPGNGFSNLVISANEISDCEPGLSEALTLNGNVHDFAVVNNYVHDVNSVAIDFIGGEGLCADPLKDIVRNGVCIGNRITKAVMKVAGRYGAGIFVDGARDIVIERNQSYKNDVGIGIGIGAASVGKQGASNITVRDNVIYNNNGAGILLGAGAAGAMRADGCAIVNNSVYANDKKRTGSAELRVLWASNTTIQNNVFFADKKKIVINSQLGTSNNIFDYNLIYSADKIDKAQFIWNNVPATGWAAFVGLSQMGSNTIFADPRFNKASKGDLRLRADSPAIDVGNPLTVIGAGELDNEGQPRLMRTRVDIGADEVP